MAGRERVCPAEHVYALGEPRCPVCRWLESVVASWPSPRGAVPYTTAERLLHGVPEVCADMVAGVADPAVRAAARAIAEIPASVPPAPPPRHPAVRLWYLIELDTAFARAEVVAARAVRTQSPRAAEIVAWAATLELAAAYVRSLRP